MPQLPSRIQGQPLGTANPATSATPVLLRPSVQLFQPGPSQPKEQFSHPSIPLEVARALNQIQRNIEQAASQVKADPTANKNVLENVTLQNYKTVGTGVSGWNNIPHSLGFAYRDYRICSVRNGYITGHAAIPPDAAHPATATLSLWTSLVQFNKTVPVMATIEIW